MADVNAQHQLIETRIVELLLSVIPEGWWSIRLDIAHERRPDGIDAFAMSISNVDGPSKLVVPPDDMEERVVASFVLFENAGKPWSAVHYAANFDEAIEQWRYTIDYEYSAEVRARFAKSPPA